MINWKRGLLVPAGAIAGTMALVQPSWADRDDPGATAAASAKLVLLRIGPGVLPVCADLPERLARGAGHTRHGARYPCGGATRARVAPQ
jgi:hypothetical protein